MVSCIKPGYYFTTKRKRKNCLLVDDTITIKHFPGFVYFLKIKDTGIIKIGVSQNVLNRISDLRRVTGLKIELLTLIATDDMFLLENRLHKKYKYIRIPSSEWFVFNDDMKNFTKEKTKLLYNCNEKWFKKEFKELVNEGNCIIKKIGIINGK